MARPKVAKTRRQQAEKAAEWYLHTIYGCEPDQIVRSIKTQWQRQDMWACDCMGRSIFRKSYFVQVTAGQNEAVRRRRRKLEKIFWNEHETVMVLQMVEQPDPASHKRKLFYFRIHNYDYQNNTWTVDDEAYKIPREWFTKLRTGK